MTTTIESLLMQQTPAIIAILRGVEPEQAVMVGSVLVDAGIRLIEVPLNSPHAHRSIARLQTALGAHALIGAGTVLSTDAVDAVAAAGARFVVAPNTNAAVTAHAIQCGLEVIPGFLSPSEAFAAIAAGARDLKLFPASSTGFKHVRALRDVLPAGVRIWAVGGIDESNLAQWLGAGVDGVGVGGGVFRPGQSPAQIAAAANKLVDSWHAARSIAKQSAGSRSVEP